MFQIFLYMRDPANPSDPDSCHYAFPLPISPVVDTVTMKVIRVDIMPTGTDATVKPIEKWQPRPANEYVSEYHNLRTDLKPLHVVQPEGASFTVTEEGTSTVLEWQKWRMRIGFNHREGMVLHDVSFGKICFPPWN
jgi:primary-amine oxidase